jgi:hypothetical protein
MKRYVRVRLADGRCEYCDADATRTHEVHEGETVIQYDVCSGCYRWLQEQANPLDESEAPF